MNIAEKITVDAKFKSIIIPLKPSERQQLEENIKRDGCREPISVWNNGPDCIILDGHNRYEICTRLNLPFDTIEIQGITDRLDAEIWIHENQNGRRNLTEDQRIINTAILTEKLSERAKRNRAVKARSAVKKRNPVKKPDLSVDGTDKSETFEGIDQPEESTTEKPPKPKRKKRKKKTDTRKETSKTAGVSENKVRFVLKLKKEFPELFDQVDKGEKTILQAAREVKEMKREARREVNREIIATVSPAEKIDAKFATIVIDPPWDWGDEGDNDQLGRAKPEYATLSIEKLLELPLPELAELVSGNQ